MTKRTKDVIFLRTLDTGGYKVMNLQTGRQATAWKVYETLMLDEAIKRIKQIGIKDGIKPRLTFGNQTLMDKDKDEIYQPDYKPTIV